MGIRKKNIIRWVAQGTERRKGGGRKRMDLEMEKKLLAWCLEKSIELERPVPRR